MKAQSIPSAFKAVVDPKKSVSLRLVKKLEMLAGLQSWGASVCPIVAPEKRTKPACSECDGSGKTFIQMRASKTPDRKPADLLAYIEYPIVCEKCSGRGY